MCRDTCTQGRNCAARCSSAHRGELPCPTQPLDHFPDDPPLFDNVWHEVAVIGVVLACLLIALVSAGWVRGLVEGFQR